MNLYVYNEWQGRWAKVPKAREAFGGAPRGGQRMSERVAVWRAVKRCDACNAQVDPGEEDYAVVRIDPDWHAKSWRGELTLCKVCFDGINRGNPSVSMNRPERPGERRERSGK